MSAPFDRPPDAVALAPASLANLGPGFDTLGLAIAGLVLGYGQLVITLLVVVGVVLFFGGIAAFLALAGIAHTGL